MWTRRDRARQEIEFMARKKITPKKKTTAAAKSTDAVKSMTVAAKKKNKGKASEWFSRFAQQTATVTGKPLTFILAVVIIIVWAISGPIFNYSDTWQLIINTSTTIVTFLMVFIIQNSQNRESLALQLKMSELVLAASGARNSMADIEDMSEDDLERLHDECRRRAEAVHTSLTKRQTARKGPANGDAKPA
jgi:low affinity Fe/Cu permease